MRHWTFKQRGSVIIVALWTITLMTILVTVIASQNRLSAQVAYVNQQELTNWAKVQAAVNQAEMELMLERMQQPVDQEFESFNDSIDALNRYPLYRFNGNALNLHYPQADDIVVRIFDHSGKINLRQISRPRLRALIEKQLGGPEEADADQLDDMMDAWNDWLDLNDRVSPRGAEKDYYLELNEPYTPRNGPLESVEELLQIRGFAEVFGEVDLDAAFTLYGEDELVNLNVATVEAMRLLPGLNDELIEEIVAYRQDKDFQGNGDVAQLVPEENMAELRSWLNSRKDARYYTIMAYPQPAPAIAADADPAQADEDNADASTNESLLTAYAETVYVASQRERPQVMRVNPYQKVPLGALAVADEGAE